MVGDAAARRLYHGFLLMPVVTVPAPISVAAVEAVCPVISIPRSIIAKARAEGETNANWRNEKRGTRRRWRRVVVPRRWRAVRLNHICAGVRAQSSSKPE
jgi:hypothetical protein